MREETKRIKMLHGALGVRPSPEDPPEQLHVDGVYDVPESLAQQLVGSNFAVETTEKLRAGNDAASPGFAPCPECGAQINPGAKFCGECGVALTQTRKPKPATREPKAE